MKTKKYLLSKILCVIMIVVCVVIASTYGVVKLFTEKQLDSGKIPQFGDTAYIAITDDQFSNKVKDNSLVFGKSKDAYVPGDIVAVVLNQSDQIVVTPNACGDVAIVQILEQNDATYLVSYNDTDLSFYIKQDAILCGITYQITGLGWMLNKMLAPMAFLFWLVLPMLLLLLGAVMLSYLKEKSRQENIAANQQPVEDIVQPEVPQQVNIVESKPESKPEHPLFSGRTEEPFFVQSNEEEQPNDADTDVQQQAAEKIANMMEHEKSKDASASASAEPEENSSPVSERVITGTMPAQPSTTVVYQVGAKEEPGSKVAAEPSPEDLDLMMLQDKIENIIHTNNRRLENEVEQKLRGMSTEKEQARRELEKTREFFVTPARRFKD